MKKRDSGTFCLLIAFGPDHNSRVARKPGPLALAASNKYKRGRQPRLQQQINPSALPLGLEKKVYTSLIKRSAFRNHGYTDDSLEHWSR